MKLQNLKLLTIATLLPVISLSTVGQGHAQETHNLPNKDADGEDKSARDDVSSKAAEMLDALDEEKKEEFITMMQEAQGFLAQKRIQEALDKITDAEIILPDHPDVLNLKGSIFVNIRDFDRAAECFDRVKELYPGMWQTDFNRVEMDFVRDDWDTALKGFKQVQSAHGDALDANTARLIDLKIAICHLKLDQPAEAKKVINKYGYYDSTPIFYYGNAAMAFQEGNDVGASEWIRNAKEIYPPQLNAVFEDSLFEAGWLLML